MRKARSRAWTGDTSPNTHSHSNLPPTVVMPTMSGLNNESVVSFSTCAVSFAPGGASARNSANRFGFEKNPIDQTRN